MNYRNRKLLDLAYQITCTLLIPGVCVGGYGEPCHANWSIYGKGMSIKAHDCFFASGCRACHRELDQGHRFGKEEKLAIWEAGYHRTTLSLWRMGLIGVIEQ